MLKYYADGEKGMQRTNILNLDIKQSKLYGFFKNAVLLLLFLFFSIFGKSFVQFGSLFKEVFARMAAEEMMCVLQFALNELGRFYFAVKAAVAALALCTGIFNACRAIFASVRKGRSLGVRFVARRAVASVDGAAVFCAPVYSFCLRYKVFLRVFDAENFSPIFSTVVVGTPRDFVRAGFRSRLCGEGRIFSCPRLRRQEKIGLRNSSAIL